MNFQPAIPLPLEDRALEEIVDEAKDFAFTRGLVFKLRDKLPYSYSVTFIPFALLPSPWPRNLYQNVCALQADINLIYYRVSNDYEFLQRGLKGTCEVDDFIQRLWSIYEKTREGQKDVPALAILRSDYMADVSGQAIQVEVNTVSAGFGGVSPVVKDLHDHLVKKLQKPELLKDLPDNNGLQIAQSLAHAWRAYGNPEAVIVFVIEDVVYNTYDQRHQEFALSERCGVPSHKVLRLGNKDMIKARLGDDRSLIVGKHEVAVVYQRTWYDPCQLPTEEHWKMREIVESSKAIKCPNIAWHLVGCKKIQQELARPGVLERFCDDGAQIQRMLAVFAGLYALEEPDNFKMVSETPENFVLKPQREGGGHNIYGNDIGRFLATLPAAARKEYIAMDMIKPLITKNYLVNKDSVKLTNVISELGIFGYVLGDTKRILKSETNCGWIFRAKDATMKEGGVAAGYGHLDCPRLI